jgi:hypothetical protein
LSTAASSTRTLARQMSAPVPSPSMKGMIGWSGTASLPFLMVIFSPVAGGVIFTVVMDRELLKCPDVVVR